MNPCELFGSADVEMFFYGELDVLDRARVERHLRGCEPCRQRLDDLHAIRRALASRRAVDAPPAGDWSAFMQRLDAAVADAAVAAAAVARPAEPSSVRVFERAHPSPNSRTVAPGNLRGLLALAATLALVTIGVLVAMRARPVHPAGSVAPATQIVASAATDRQTSGSATDPQTAGSATDPRKVAAQADRALRESSVEHLERSKLVVLGLATRDPHARPRDWQYERALAGTLLSDTRLYRQAAMQDGASDVERLMRDLETVLLEASMSDAKDRAALARVQRLIARRDLVVKMQVMAAAGN